MGCYYSLVRMAQIASFDYGWNLYVFEILTKSICKRWCEWSRFQFSCNSSILKLAELRDYFWIL
jgi:hypothetical protein